MLEQQPFVALAAGTSVNLHQRPLAEHLLSEHAKREFARANRLDGIIAGLDELPRAVVPDDDVAAAVVPGRDHALEGCVIVRMILGHHREAFDRRVVRRPLRNCPRFEHPLHLQTEVVVEVRGVVFLDDEDGELRFLRFSAGRLRRVAEVAHRFVFLE
jgi:hypothetical protein